ncbi:MAG: DUF3047 domain-containing protein [Alphaproteobacteria bacterium]
MKRFVVIITLCLATAPAAAGSLPTPPDLERAGWSTFSFDNSAPARFIGHEDGRLEVYTYSSTSLLYRDLISDEPGERLSWRWRVDRATARTDLSQKGGDDRSLAVHLWFPETAGHRPGLFTQIGRGVARALGAPVPGNSITYVWGGKHPPATMLPNPYFNDGVIIVLESNQAPLKTWRDVSVDWRADFKNAFGYEAPAPSHIAVSADSDDTGSQSRGFIADIHLGTD